MNMLDSALRYLNHFGYSVIPVGQDKRPLIKWEEYQKRKPTESEVKQWWLSHPSANIGIVTGDISGLSVVDVDSQEASELLTQYIPESTECPTCQTPRGGHHLYFKYSGHSSKNGVLKNIDFKSQGGYVVAPPSKNGNGKQYSWTVKPSTCHPPAIPDAFIKIINKCSTNIINTSYYNGDASGQRDKQLQALQSVTLNFDQGMRDESIFHVANCLIKGGMTENNASYILNIIAKNSNPPFPEREVEVKIKSAIERGKRKDRNLTREISDWISVTSGDFCVTSALQALQSVTKEDRITGRQIFHRLAKEGIIERVGNKDGWYRRVEKVINFVDISKVDDLKFISLKWPMQVEEWVKVSPKSVVIIAGDTDAGKSAFLSAFADLNMDKHRILYFSSEMTAARFKNRVNNLGRPLKDWAKVLFTEDVVQNFHDGIDPEAINIIDYLELDPGRVFDVAVYIRKIFDNLTTGIAIIALQKKRGMGLAYGADWTMQKSEFYLTLSKTDDGNLAKIEKAKNWAGEYANPVGMKKKFLLLKGIKFLPDKMRPDWFKGEGNKEEDYV